MMGDEIELRSLGQVFIFVVNRKGHPFKDDLFRNLPKVWPRPFGTVYSSSLTEKSRL